MKQANITLKLTKDHHIHKVGVTPIEVTLLAALHGANNTGENPVDVDEKSIADTPDKDRTEDQEINRLHRRYGRVAVDSILGKIRQLPKDFSKGKSGATVAAELGLANPVGKTTPFANPSAAGISETKVV
jgi:hypothetical protein